jgi:hypothetical protein
VPTGLALNPLAHPDEPDSEFRQVGLILGELRHRLGGPIKLLRGAGDIHEHPTDAGGRDHQALVADGGLRKELSRGLSQKIRAIRAGRVPGRA